MKTHWTASLTLCIVKALFALIAVSAQAETPAITAKVEPRATEQGRRSAEEELKSLRQEETVLRQELSELLTKYDALEAEYRRLQLSVAASYARGEKTDLTDRDTDVLASFKMVADAGRNLA